MIKVAESKENPIILATFGELAEVLRIDSA